MLQVSRSCGSQHPGSGQARSRRKTRRLKTGDRRLGAPLSDQSTCRQRGHRPSQNSTPGCRPSNNCWQRIWAAGAASYLQVASASLYAAVEGADLHHNSIRGGPWTASFPRSFHPLFPLTIIRSTPMADVICHIAHHQAGSRFNLPQSPAVSPHPLPP